MLPKGGKFTSGMKWSDFIRRRSASYGGTSKQGVTVIQWRAAVAAWRCEVVPDGTVKRSLAASFRHFFAVQKCSYGIAFISFRLSRIFAKKMAAGFFFFPRHSETHFEAKNSEFRWEMKIWKSLHFCEEKLRILGTYGAWGESFITPKSDFFNPSIGPSCKTMCLGRYPSLLIWSFISVTLSESGSG